MHLEGNVAKHIEQPNVISGTPNQRTVYTSVAIGAAVAVFHFAWSVQTAVAVTCHLLPHKPLQLVVHHN